MRTNNYKTNITKNCPKCNSLDVRIDLEMQKSSFSFKRIKSFEWKRVFTKTEKATGTYYFDNQFGSVYKSVCRNFEDYKKNPQRLKIRVAPLFEDGKKKLDKTYNMLCCYNCGHYEYTENGSYLDVLKQKSEI